MKKLVKDQITALMEGKKPSNDTVKKAEKPLLVRESVVVAEEALLGEFIVGELEVGGKSVVEESVVRERDLQQGTAQQAAAREKDVEGTRKRRTECKGFPSKSARKGLKGMKECVRWQQRQRQWQQRLWQ